MIPGLWIGSDYMDSRQRFIIRRCYETGYPVKAAVELSECSEDTVKTIYDRLGVDRLKRYERFIANAGPIAK